MALRQPSFGRLWLPPRQKLISTSLSAGTGMRLATAIALKREFFTLSFWHQRTHSDSVNTFWATHTGQFQVFNGTSGDVFRAKVYNNKTAGGSAPLTIGGWDHVHVAMGVDHLGSTDVRLFINGSLDNSLTNGATGSEVTSVGTHYLFGDDAAGSPTDDGYRGAAFHILLLDGIWEPEETNRTPDGRWQDISDSARRALIYEIGGQHSDPGRDSSGNGNHFIVEAGGVTLSPLDLPPGANEGQFRSVAYLPAAAAGGADHDLLAADLEAQAEVDAPSVGQKHVIAADDLESQAEVSAPAVGQVHALLAADLESAAEVSKPTATESHLLTADDLEAAAEVSAPSVGQVHAILADDLEAAAEVSAPAVGQVHAILAADLESAAEVSVPVIAQIHALLAADLESAAEVSKPVLAEVGAADHDLLAADLESAAEVSSPSIGQVHAVLGNGLEATTEVGSPGLAQLHAMLAGDLESAAEVSTPTLISDFSTLIAGSVSPGQLVAAPSSTEPGLTAGTTSAGQLIPR